MSCISQYFGYLQYIVPTKSCDTVRILMLGIVTYLSRFIKLKCVEPTGWQYIYMTFDRNILTYGRRDG